MFRKPKIGTRIVLVSMLAASVLVGVVTSPATSAQATNCSVASYPSQGSIQTSNYPGSNQYTATMQFSLNADQLCSLQQAGEFLEIDFDLRNFDVPAGWEGYTITNTNLPGAIHDVAFEDPQYIANPAATRIYTSALQAGTNYSLTMSWTASARSGQPAPVILFGWTPSRWINQTHLDEYTSCTSPLYGNNSAQESPLNPNEAWCVFPAIPMHDLFGYLPLDGFRWYTWGTAVGVGNVVQGIGVPVSVPVAPLPPTPGRTVLINGGGMAFAGPGTTNWTQLTQNNDALRVVVGGNRVGLINGCRALFVTDNLTNWTQITPCNGAVDIAIGSSGRVVFTNSARETYASDNLVNWTQLTPANGTQHIAVGGSRVGVINGCGSLNVTDNLVNWTQITPCNGALSVAIGSSGRTAFINGCGSAYAGDNLVNWTQITPCNGALAIVVGGSRVVFENGGGETYASDNMVDWVRLTPPNGTMYIAAGKSGRVAVTNGCGSTNVTDDLVHWTQITGCNDTQGIALG